ncbi:MAG: matrixin family metalloprotease [Halioglobus sp.]|nr:matrixin family metalloprotease [Halioglobus sp.]
MNNRGKAVLAVLLCGGLSHSGGTLAYQLAGSYWQSGEAHVHVDLAASNPPGANQPNIVSGGPSTSALQNAYLQAMTAWNNNSTFHYTATSNSGYADPCETPATAPQNSVLFADTSCGSAFGGTTLAVQQTWFSGSATSKTGTVFNNTKQWDLYTGNWTGTAEFKRVAVHELGHGLGLNHSSDSTAIMWPSAGNTKIPQADDIAGAAVRYDSDSDGVGFALDNCPATANASQSDVDADGAGDACDADIDGDGVYNGTGVDASFGLDSLGNSYYSFAVGSNAYRAMSFPVTFSGSLTTVTLPIYCTSGDLVLSIQGLNGSGKPNGSNLASKQFASGAGVPTTYQGAVDYIFDSPASVSGGSSLAVIAQALGSCRWFVSSAGSYSEGAGFFSANGSSWGNTVDYPFSATITPSVLDNCPSVPNAAQPDLDGDSAGDACDSDIDGDGLSNDDETGIYLTDPYDADSDDDTYSDGEEVAAGSDPNDDESVPTVADGDINGDSVVDVADILLGQKILLGMVSPTAAQIQRGDVAPLVGGVPAPDGLFEAGDLLIIQQKVNGQIVF